MKTVQVEFIWRTVEDLEVPDDWEIPTQLSGFPQDQLLAISSATASLYDWRLY